MSRRDEGGWEVRAYRWFVRLLPRRMSRGYETDMVELFRDRLDEVGPRRSRRLVLLLRTLIDWIRHAPAIWMRRGGASGEGRGWRTGGRGSGRGRGIDSVAQDLRFALRTLKKRPLFTGVAVLTLGLGIGAATSMFSVVDGVLLKPLPYSDPDRLVSLWQTVPELREIPGDDGARWDRYRFTWLQYRELSARSTVYQDLAAYKAGVSHVATLTGVGDPVELRAGAATASFLPLLGVRPALGRWFLPGEEASLAGNDGASVVVIGHDLWQDRFGGSPGTVGTVVTLDDRPFTIIGVLPPGFRVNWLSALVAGEGDPGKREMWFPIGAPGWSGLRSAYSWEIIGRLPAGITPEQAWAETEAILSAHPDTNGEVRVMARSAEETLGLAPSLLLLFGSTALLLLIACGNIAMLFMAELQGRRHEISTRSALGAGAPRIVRLILTESVLLAAVGSAVGTVLAFAGTEALVALAPPIPRLQEVGVDLRVLVFAVLTGTCAAFLFGLVPSLRASHGASASALHASARMSQGRQRFTGVVIGAQIALTAMLLVAGGLLTRSLSRLLAVDPGFDTRGLATVEVRLPSTRYPTRAARGAFFREALQELEGVPGIGRVTGASRLPFPGHTSGWDIQPLGAEDRFHVLGYQVEPGYLRTLGVPLLAGRFLAETDGPDAPVVMVINETMARRYWPHESPVGSRVEHNGLRDPVTIVGIVGDLKRQVLSAQVEPAFFIPFSQLPDQDICFVARSEFDPLQVLPAMREAIRAVDGNLAVKNATTMEALVAESASHERYRTLLMNVFGLLAALLAAAGVFGVTARSVAMRTREMGIRMALGAPGADLVGATVWGIALTGLAGTGVGLVAAFCSSRVFARFLFGIEPSDPATFAAVAALVLIVCLLAGYAPARRISRVNPVDVLKAE